MKRLSKIRVYGVELQSLKHMTDILSRLFKYKPLQYATMTKKSKNLRVK